MQELYRSSVRNRMNFEYMPELAIRWAYPALLGGMALAAGGMLFYFRRRRWL